MLFALWFLADSWFAKHRRLMAMPDPERFGWTDRLIAEAVRVREEARGEPDDDPAAATAAVAAASGFEARLIARAGALKVASDLQAALRRLAGARTLALIVAAVIALFAGGSAAGILVAAGPGEPVNVFRTLTVLLGVHLLALTGWIAALAAGGRGAAMGWLGGVAIAGGRWLARRFGSGSPAETGTMGDVARASGLILTSGRTGRWLVSAVSHGLWLAFFAGAIAAVLLLLATRNIRFVWETTILSAGDYVRLTEVLALLPGLLGFPAPTAGEVLASEWPGAVATDAREAWAGFLVGCLVIYGAAVRAGLLLLSVVLAWRALRAYRLDTTRPGFARLYPLLTPVTAAPMPHDREAVEELPARTAPPPKIRLAGPTAVLGLEIDPPTGRWPPAIEGVTWLDLGLVDDRSSRRLAVDKLRAARPPARQTLVIAQLTTTPDRGIRAFLGDLQASTATAVRLALSGGEAVRSRVGEAGLDQRIGDWQRCAAGAGIPLSRTAVIEAIDAGALGRWLAGGGA